MADLDDIPMRAEVQPWDRSRGQFIDINNAISRAVFVSLRVDCLAPSGSASRMHRATADVIAACINRGPIE